MNKGVIESIYDNFKMKCVDSYGMVHIEYIAEFAKQLKENKQDSHILIAGSIRE